MSWILQTLIASYPTNSLRDGLVSAYYFEWNSNDSIGSNNGTDTNITYSTGNGKITQGAGFNGTSSWINIWNGLNSTMTGSAWSIVIWWNSTWTAHQIMVANDNNTGTRQFAMWILNSQVYFERAWAAVIFNTWTTVSWYYQIIFTYTWGRLYWHLNNSAITDVAMTALPSSTNNVNIGRRQYTGSNLYYNWALDILLFYNKALSSQERTSLYNGWTWIQP